MEKLGHLVLWVERFVFCFRDKKKFNSLKNPEISALCRETMPQLHSNFDSRICLEYGNAYLLFLA